MKKSVLTLSLLVTPLALSTPVENKEGFWFFGGLGVSYQRVSTSATINSVSGSTLRINEVAKNGFGFSLRPALSWYTSSIVVDLGLGFSLSRFSYSNFDPDPTGSGSADNTTAVDNNMTLRNGVFELNPRLRLGDEFQVGPLLQLHFGGGDAGHSELATETKTLVYYGGGQLNYEFPVGDATLMRLGLQGLYGFGESGRNNLMLNGIWEIGFALFDDGSPEEVRFEEPPEPVQSVDEFVFEEFDDNIPSARETAPQQITVRLPSDKFLFDTAMSHIRNRQTREYLREYGRILTRNMNNWDFIEVIGHTDRRGTRRVNQELSEGRARTVHLHLSEGGVPANRMRWSGRAFDEPADTRDNPTAWSRNRRVELVISGVRATPEMLAQVEDLNRRYGYAPDGRR